jgi:hypothetical protein
MLVNLFHVQFEDRLFMPILKKRATWYKDQTSGDRKFLKKLKVFKGRPLYFKIRLFSNTRIRLKLGAPVHARVCQTTGTHPKE